MADHLTKKQRSYCMSQIKSKWTTLDKMAHKYLKGNKIKHKMYPKIIGSPDLVLKDKKVAIFLNGCFWHSCPKCYKKPKNNALFWKKKRIHNICRDKTNILNLRKSGWKVLNFWEHDFKKNPQKFISKVRNALV